jgi:hypothetical protein
LKSVKKSAPMSFRQLNFDTKICIGKMNTF